ncbi:DDE Tnp4 domain-containing protein [Mycena indigotica]|uniref:DDE Tnp4 domain-containing protein n=1 Tax=Mycena indigotica TaxID=2126181 RepID=A0A8H6T866_9AGAR|nr:DDE Tnp4 domain-containing protein [Mycena indigotica]KAF7311727.1 DDE Tnp4 domain-containing protein [Mycena indigotica]
MDVQHTYGSQQHLGCFTAPTYSQRMTRLSFGIPSRLRQPLVLDHTGGLESEDDGDTTGSSINSDSDSSSRLRSSNSDSDSSVDSFDLRNEHLRIPRRYRRTPIISSRVLGWVEAQIREMYAQRYSVPRVPLIRPESRLKTCLESWKHKDKLAFRGELRIWPTTFDKLLRKIEGHAVFTNNSNYGQTPVEIQLAVALYQFGHDGNGVSLQAVSWWSGLGKGTVPRCTRRVITAILGSGMLAEYVRMPTASEKEEAKAWVEKTSGCREWRDGWCMVDGTLIPLATRPNWFGPSYFDRKMNYSMNLQVINLPNLQIVDIGYGYVGSTHDATAWTGTRVYQELDKLLLSGEFIWGDAAYPISRWLTAPFKSPEREDPDNTIFNNHVSYVRVRSEHCIGFLKGRLQSLKGLRLTINNDRDHTYVTQWIMTCVVVHNFALLHEAKLRAKRPSNLEYTAPENDPFIPAEIRRRRNGPQRENPDSEIPLEMEGTSAGRRARLAAGKAKRNELKEYLLNALDNRRQRFRID